MGWSIVSEELGEFIEILPPQKRVGEQWYQGTADAVYQNLYSIIRENPKYLVVLSGQMQMVMDEGEVTLRPGTCIVQQATNHAWVNKGSEPCVVVAILVDGAKPQVLG